LSRKWPSSAEPACLVGSKYQAPLAGWPLTVTVVARANAVPSVGATLNHAMIGIPTPYTPPSFSSNDTWTGLAGGPVGAVVVAEAVAELLGLAVPEVVVEPVPPELDVEVLADRPGLAIALGAGAWVQAVSRPRPHRTATSSTQERLARRCRVA
jgi:hypothetical protein